MNPVFQHASTPLEPGITVIAASAGTGKTFTLAALVVRLVAEQGIPIQRLLLTTYTVAATAELRDRIRARLIATLAAVKAGVAPDDDFLGALLPLLPATAAERLEAAIRDFDEATIHTIHGFCQRALRELAFETGTPFDPELIADTTALFTEITQDYWRAHVYPAPPIVAASLASTELSAAALLGPLRTFAGRPSAKVIPDAVALPGARAELVALLQEFKTEWPNWREQIESLLVSNNSWGKRGYYGEELEPKFAMLEAAAREDATGAALVDACKTFCHLTSDCIRDGTNQTKCKTAIEHPLFTFCDRFAAARQHLHESTIAHFLAWSRSALDERKAQRGILLFDDLLIRLHHALGEPGRASSTAAQLGSRYDAILVDEFQDTDPIQADIFLRVFGTDKHRLFLIGDPKQAIYAFRGADLFAYLDAVSRADRHYTLRENQRSSTAMVGAVNALFTRPTDPFADPRIPFEPVAAAGRADKAPLRVAGATRAPFHFWFWKSDQRISRTALKRALPRMVAWEVTRFLHAGATIGDRAALPDDCAVLCRDNRQARDIAELLADNGVPAVVLSNANVFDSEEATEFRAILASLADPGREPLLRNALACIALGCTMADLLDLENTPAKWEHIRQRWHAHHARWRELGFIRMFREFLRIEQIRPRLLAHRDGERHLTNLQHLAELTHAAAEAQHLGPSGVLHWLHQQMQPGAATEETELRLDRDDSAVRVITVHKSKGLEFPVVFCPFLWGDVTIRDKGPLCFHDASGQTIYDLRKERDPEHERRAQDEEFAEQTRLLYVALTRAKHECHVVWGPFGKGTKKEKDPEISALLRLLEPPPGAPTFEALANHAAAACSPSRLDATISALCDQSPELFARRDLPVLSAPRFESREEAGDTLNARIFKGRIDATWRSTSYTVLNAGIDYEAEALERRLFSPESLRGIHAFPRGIKAGSCLHDILEHVDFTATPEQRADFLARKLRQHAMGSPENVTAVEALIAEIAAVLPPQALAPATSLRELEFHLPAGLLTPAALQAFTEGAALTFDRQRGILTGFIDLVFERENRFYILDWKSNWLGADASAYQAATLEGQMRRHRYGLQRQLYLFALHRFLGSRLAGYDPATHLGGALYVFLRGLDRKMPELGIVTSTADVQALRDLEPLFRSE
jgi:exodeoxyribonuclease V beta subunit